MYRRLKQSIFFLFLFVSLVSCKSNTGEIEDKSINKFKLKSSSDNVLSVTASFISSLEDSFYLELRKGNNIHQSKYSALGKSHELKVIGLYPETEYELSIKNENYTSKVIKFNSKKLPKEVTNHRILETDGSVDGYYLVAQCKDIKNAKRQNHHLKIIDANGKTVWYKYFKHNTNNYFLTKDNTILYVSPNESMTAKNIYEEDLYGNIIFKSADIKMRLNHWIYKTANDTYLSIDYDTVSLSTNSLAAKHLVIGNKFVEIDRNSEIVWEASTFDFYDPMKKLFFNSPEGNILNLYKMEQAEDWTHANSIVEDENGFIISIKNTHQIVKIDKESKKLIWSMGGLSYNSYESDFKLKEEERFINQHAVQRYGNRLLVYDNGDHAARAFSRLIDFEIDEKNTRIVSSKFYDLPKQYMSAFQGNIVPLENGNLLTTSAAKSVIFQFNNKGEIVWLSSDEPNEIFKVFYLPSIE